MTSKNNTENVRRCRQARYDIVTLPLAKGTREPIKEHASSMGESLYDFIRRAIRETMERDNAKE